MKIANRAIANNYNFSSHVNLFLLILYFVSIYDGCHQSYCDNNFMMYVSQIILLFILNFYSAVCQLHLNRTGRRKQTKKSKQEQHTML